MNTNEEVTQPSASSGSASHYKECGDAPNLCGKPGYDGGFWTPRRDRSSEKRVTCPDCRAILNARSADERGARVSQSDVQS